MVEHGQGDAPVPGHAARVGAFTPAQLGPTGYRPLRVRDTLF